MTRREYRRLVLHVRVNWGIEAQQVAGEGLLLDVSLTGARVHISGPFNAHKGATFTLQAAAIPALPRTARLRWFRHDSGLRPFCVCGLVFAPEAADHGPWREWVSRAYAEDVAARTAARPKSRPAARSASRRSSGPSPRPIAGRGSYD